MYRHFPQFAWLHETYKKPRTCININSIIGPFCTRFVTFVSFWL